MGQPQAANADIVSARYLGKLPEPYSCKTVEIEGHRLKLR